MLLGMTAVAGTRTTASCTASGFATTGGTHFANFWLLRWACLQRDSIGSRNPRRGSLCPAVWVRLSRQVQRFVEVLWGGAAKPMAGASFAVFIAFRRYSTVPCAGNVCLWGVWAYPCRRVSICIFSVALSWRFRALLDVFGLLQNRFSSMCHRCVFVILLHATASSPWTFAYKHCTLLRVTAPHRCENLVDVSVVVWWCCKFTVVHSGRRVLSCSCKVGAAFGKVRNAVRSQVGLEISRPET